MLGMGMYVHMYQICTTARWQILTMFVRALAVTRIGGKLHGSTSNALVRAIHVQHA